MHTITKIALGLIGQLKPEPASGVAEPIIDYIVQIAQESRRLPHGLSPRASLGLLHASQAMAFLDERRYVTPEDVQAIALSVMHHRLVGGDEVNPRRGLDRAREIMTSIKVP